VEEKMFMTNFVICKHAVNVNQQKPQIKWKRKSSVKCEKSRAYAIAQRQAENKQIIEKCSELKRRN
jgi:hypothetical protein